MGDVQRPGSGFILPFVSTLVNCLRLLFQAVESNTLVGNKFNLFKIRTIERAQLCCQNSGRGSLKILGQSCTFVGSCMLGTRFAWMVLQLKSLLQNMLHFWTVSPRLLRQWKIQRDLKRSLTQFRLSWSPRWFCGMGYGFPGFSHKMQSRQRKSVWQSGEICLLSWSSFISEKEMFRVYDSQSSD